MNNHLSLVSVLVLCAVSQGCSASPPPPCGAIAVINPVITVTDAADGHPICDAMVVATCAGASGTLVAFAGGHGVDASVPGCDYGPGLDNVCERGTGPIPWTDRVASVTVTKSGYATQAIANIAPKYGGCVNLGPFPEPQKVRVELHQD